MENFNNQENIDYKNNKRKRRMIVAIISMILCLLLMTISVYAATMQSSNIVNKITITGSNDVRAKVVVSESLGNSTLLPGEEEVPLYNGETTFGTFTELLRKEKNVNNLSTGDEGTTNPTEIVFTKSNVYTYVVYKFELLNEGQETINFSIQSKNADLSADYSFNNQIDIYTGTNASGDIIMTKSDTKNVSISGTLSNEEDQNSVTLYVVIAVNVSLLDVKTVSQESFALVCSLNNI